MRSVSDMTLTVSLIILIGLVSVLYFLPSLFAMISLTNKDINPAIVVKDFFVNIFSYQKSDCLPSSSFILPLYKDNYNALYFVYEGNYLKQIYLLSCSDSYISKLNYYYKFPFQSYYIAFYANVNDALNNCNEKIPLIVFNGKTYVLNIMPFQYYGKFIDSPKTTLIYSNIPSQYYIYVSACKKYKIEKPLERYNKKEYDNIIYLYFFITQ